MPLPACLITGTVLVEEGGVCDPYSYAAAGCWGAAPMCSFAKVCVGIPDYGVDVWAGDWGYWKPSWWLPLYPIFRCE
jgi:hypothetical protein